MKSILISSLFLFLGMFQFAMADSMEKGSSINKFVECSKQCRKKNEDCRKKASTSCKQKDESCYEPCNIAYPDCMAKCPKPGS